MATDNRMTAQQKREEQDRREQERKRRELEEYKNNRIKVGKLLETNRNEIAKSLPKFITPEKMMRVALTAMNRQPDLMRCTSNSLMSCIITAGQLGLLPDSTLGECYLMPIRRHKGKESEYMECQIIIGYRGLVALAYRSGIVKSVEARPVFKNDLFECNFGLNDVLMHKPNGRLVVRDKHIRATDDDITDFYCLIKFNNGGHVFDVMTKAEVEHVRDESQNYKYAEYPADTVWGKYFREMGQKTVLRRLMKFVPLSPEVQRAIGLDDQADAGVQKTSLLLLDQMPTALAEEAISEVIDDENAAREKEKDDAKNDARGQADAAAASLREKLNQKIDPK